MTTFGIENNFLKYEKYAPKFEIKDLYDRMLGIIFEIDLLLYHETSKIRQEKEKRKFMRNFIREISPKFTELIESPGPVSTLEEPEIVIRGVNNEPQALSNGGIVGVKTSSSIAGDDLQDGIIQIGVI